MLFLTQSNIVMSIDYNNIIKKIQVKCTKSHIVPDILKYIKTKGCDKYYSVETNKRTVTHFKYQLPNDDYVRYIVNYARNQIFKNQFHIPIKVLVPASTNTYVCQKSLLTSTSNDINSASKVIEPLSIGFDDYIKYIPINQNLKVGTVFTIDVKVPYESNHRYRFKSDQLVSDSVTEIPFDQNIDIGELDIGSRYCGKFTVEYTDLNIYGSYTMFTFNITPDGFDILTYDFMNVDVKFILEEVIKIINNTDYSYQQQFSKVKDYCIQFLNNCIEAL